MNIVAQAVKLCLSAPLLKPMFGLIVGSGVHWSKAMLCMLGTFLSRGVPAGFLLAGFMNNIDLL